MCTMWTVDKCDGKVGRAAIPNKFDLSSQLWHIAPDMKFLGVSQDSMLDLMRSKYWVVGIMVGTSFVKFLLMVYCRMFSNEIVRAYAQDHFFDVVTNLIGLVAAVLATMFAWWIDPAGAIVVI